MCSCSRLLGLLSVPIGASALKLRLGQLDEPVANGIQAEIEVERARNGLEGRRQERRPATAAALCLALAEQQDTGRDRSGPPAGRDRRWTRSRRGAPTGTPRRRSGWRAYSASEIARLTAASPRNSRRSLWPAAPSRCSWCQLEWTSACSSRSRSRTGRPSRLRQGLGGPHDARRPPAAGPNPARTNARRCTRRRPGRCGSSPRPRPRSPSRTPLRGS